MLPQTAYLAFQGDPGIFRPEKLGKSLGPWRVLLRLIPIGVGRANVAYNLGNFGIFSLVDRLSTLELQSLDVVKCFSSPSLANKCRSILRILLHPNLFQQLHVSLRVAFCRLLGFNVPLRPKAGLIKTALALVFKGFCGLTVLRLIYFYRRLQFSMSL